MAKSLIRILVADDFEPFRKFLFSTLQYRPDVQVICEVSDGLAAVQRAQELQPDLILLDIDLPKLNGIEAVRRIRELSPQSKILIVSQESSADVMQEVLHLGASGYIVKFDAGSELSTGVDAVLRGERFVGSRFTGQDFTDAADSQSSSSFSRKTGLLSPAPTLLRATESNCRHEAQFYSDDASFLDGFTQFIGPVLKAGSAVIVVATEPHRDNLLLRLHGQGVDIAAAIEEGRYISLDAADTLSRFMINDLPDPARFLEAADRLITAAAQSAKGEHPRVAICGECDPPLWALGSGEAAIRLEQLWNEIANTHDVEILCGYPLSSFHGAQDTQMFQRICAEHSSVYSG